MIVIVNDNLFAAAILDPVGGVVRISDDAFRAPLVAFSDDMLGQPAHLRVVSESGETRQVGYEEVRPGDVRYEQALIHELEARGLSCFIADQSLMGLMDLLGTSAFTVDQRRHIISVMRNLKPEDAAEAAQTIRDIARLGVQAQETV